MTEETSVPQPGNLPEDPTLSVCMIVRDEAEILGRCLDSIFSIAHELIVVDTGSKDDTVAIAEDFGANVFYFDWIDDFSAARNKSLKHAGGDWILQFDADDELLPDSIPPLRSALHQSELLYCPIRYDNGPRCYGKRFNWVGRLFRNHPRLHYDRPYHEGVDSSVHNMIRTEPRWKIAYMPEIVVRHHGYERAQIGTKCKRGVSIMESYLKENPDDAYMLTKLGRAYGMLGRHRKAEKCFKKALTINPDAEVSYDMGVTLYNQNKLDSAVPYLKEAVARDPALAEACRNLGSIFLQKGKLEEAIFELEKALRINPELSPAHNDMGVALSHLGKFADAVCHFSEAIRILPDYAQAHCNLGSGLARQGRFQQAISHFKEALRINPNFEEAKYYIELASKRLGID